MTLLAGFGGVPTVREERRGAIADLSIKNQDIWSGVSEGWWQQAQTGDPWGKNRSTTTGLTI
jgi:hypothetical protein